MWSVIERAKKQWKVHVMYIKCNKGKSCTLDQLFWNSEQRRNICLKITVKINFYIQCMVLKEVPWKINGSVTKAKNTICLDVMAAHEVPHDSVNVSSSIICLVNLSKRACIERCILWLPVTSSPLSSDLQRMFARPFKTILQGDCKFGLTAMSTTAAARSLISS